MIEIRLATLVVIWFPKYVLTNKSMLDLKTLHALGIATNMIKLFHQHPTFYIILLFITYLLLNIAIHFFIAYGHIHFNCKLNAYDRVDMLIDYHLGAFLHQCVCWFFIVNVGFYSIWYRDFKIRSHWITHAYGVSTKIAEFEIQHFHC